MSIDFSKFKASSTAASESLQKNLDATTNKSKNFGDENVWKPTVDRDGNASALFRFIFDPSEKMFVELKNHGIKRGGRWFIENCAKTIDWDKPCAACEYGNDLKQDREWDSIPKEEQSVIRQYFAKTSYWTNIYMIKDPVNPENNGKVFKYRFGKKIADKIDNAMATDELDGTLGFSAYDPFHGADFKLVVKRVSGFHNYDDSSFANPSAWLKGNVKKMAKIVEEEAFELGAIVDIKQFKSDADFTEKFNNFIGKKATATIQNRVKVEETADAVVTEEDTSTKEEEVSDDYFKSLIDDI